jgi:hypothetical protein
MDSEKVIKVQCVDYVYQLMKDVINKPLKK